MPTTSLGFPQPAIGSNQWGLPTNAGWALLDQFLNGLQTIPALTISGNVTIGGTLTAGSITGIISTGIVLVTPSATPVFDASKGLELGITLSTTVTSSTFINGNIGPSIIVFRITQDAIGGHSFAWPSNVRNGGSVNKTANARSVQMFAVDFDGSLDAVGPMMYS